MARKATKVKYSLFIDRSLEERLRAYAEKYGMTLTAAYEQAIRMLLKSDYNRTRRNEKLAAEEKQSTLTEAEDAPVET